MSALHPDFFDGVFFNRKENRIEKYRDGQLVTYFRAGLHPSLARRLGMDADPETYPDFPGNSAQPCNSPAR